MGTICPRGMVGSGTTSDGPPTDQRSVRRRMSRTPCPGVSPRRPPAPAGGVVLMTVAARPAAGAGPMTPPRMTRSPTAPRTTRSSSGPGNRTPRAMTSRAPAMVRPHRPPSTTAVLMTCHRRPVHCPFRTIVGWVNRPPPNRTWRSRTRDGPGSGGLDRVSGPPGSVGRDHRPGSGSEMRSRGYGRLRHRSVAGGLSGTSQGHGVRPPPADGGVGWSPWRRWPEWSWRPGWGSR